MSTIPLTVIIVDKTGTLKSYNIKDFKETGVELLNPWEVVIGFVS